MPFKTLDDLDVKGKRVFMRVDFNVPLDKTTGDVKNDRRIRGALPTIQRLLGMGASVIAMTHVGRPEKADVAGKALLTTDKDFTHAARWIPLRLAI